MAHFVVSNCPFGAPTDFEVKLEGAESRWASAGAAGSAGFNHLKEGRYVLHVRPRSAGEVGDEAALAFTVLPPWYRAPWAYVGYVLGVLGLGFLIARVASYLEHREKVRLEHLVEERTQELNAGIERRRHRFSRRAYHRLWHRNPAQFAAQPAALHAASEAVQWRRSCPCARAPARRPWSGLIRVLVVEVGHSAGQQSAIIPSLVGRRFRDPASA
jgi:hypothetical protein